MLLVLLAITHLGISDSILLTILIFWIPVQKIRYALYMPPLLSNPVLLAMARKFWLALRHVLCYTTCFLHSPTSLWVWLALPLWVVVSFLACTFPLPSCHVHTSSFPLFFLLEVLCLACGTPGWISGTILMLSTAGRGTGFIGLPYGLLLWALTLWAAPIGVVWCPLICSTQFHSSGPIFPLALLHG